MKFKAIALSFLGMVVLFMGYEYTRAESKADTPSLNIGVVSVRKIFGECKKNARYREEATAEQGKIVAEMEKLSKEIEAGKAGLKTLKAGSSDHLALMKEMFEKQARLEAQREFYKQQMALKDQRWTEELYTNILRETGEVAKQKGLDLVFEKDEIDLSTPNANELMLTIRTHKLLYSGGCLDITDEVMTRVDAEN